jgi:hypothetical protein
MLNYESIYQSFKNLVGFRQTEDPATDLIALDLTLSKSGLYANDLALNWLTNRNIQLCIPDYKQYNYEDWNSGNTYNIQDRIVYQGKLYYSLVESNSNQNPATQTSSWQYICDLPSLTSYLEKVRRSAVTELVNAVLQKNENYNSSISLLPQSMGSLFWGDIKQSQNISTGRARGFTAQTCQREDAQLQILKIGLQCDTAQTINLRIYHSSQSDAIAVYPVTIGASDINKFVWKELIDVEGNPCILNNLSSLANAGGDFWITVFEDEILGNITEYTFDTYSEVYEPHFEQFKGFFDFYFFEIQNQFLNGIELFDIEKYNYNNRKAIFNLQVAVFSDKTNDIIAGARLWVRAIQLSVAVKLLSELFQSQELNRIASSAEKEIGLLLHGNKDAGISGLKHQYFNAVKSLVKEYTATNGFEDNAKPNFTFI